MAKKGKKTQKKEEKINRKDPVERQVLYLFLVMAIIVLIFVAIVASIQGSSKFKYNGIDFKKTKQGSILFYTAKVPVLDDYGKISNYLEVDFRNDPRTLKEIQVDTKDVISFVSNKKVYVSYDQFGACENNGIAGTNLGRFLSNIGLDVKGGINDIAYENNTNLPYINCGTNPANTVVRVMNSTETKIEQTNTNCYEIHFKDCQVLEATEKFELTILEEYVRDKL